MSERLILGIDPGTIVMGYAVLAHQHTRMRLVAMGVLRSGRSESIYARLRKIHEGVGQLIQRYHPDELAIEAPFYGKNAQSVLKLGRAQGAAIVAAQLADLPVSEYPPATVKKMVTGNGAASKRQVAYYLQQLLHIPPEAMMNALDATDAVAVCVACVLAITRPLATSHASWKDYIHNHPDKVSSN